MYDTIIIGCGPAGMTSALYLARANKKVLVLEKETIGGQIVSSPLVENYPGKKALSGSELANSMYEQLEDLNVDVELEETLKIVPGKIKKVITDYNEYETKSVIIATGAKYRLLGLDNEVNLIGKGIHFCVSCDGAFYKNKTVAVIGGGNSGVINALALADLATKVYVVQDLDYLTAEETIKNKLLSTNNVEVIYGAHVKTITGTDHLTSIKVDTKGTERTLDINGMFISIGLVPQNDFITETINLNKYKYVDSSDTTTNEEGIYVAGDCRSKKYRQLTTAVSDGTIAAMNVIDYLNK